VIIAKRVRSDLGLEEFVVTTTKHNHLILIDQNHFILMNIRILFSGLGFVVLIIGGIVLMAFYICMCRGAMIQRKLDKTKGIDPASGKLFSLVHLPTTGSSTIYIPNKNILRMTEISEIVHRFDN